MKKSILLFIVSIIVQYVSAQQLAFPTAEGFGQFASGGRGGTVYHVTNLNDTGAGSFRDAVSKPNRTVVFDVAGIIRIFSIVPVSSNITIAGQTAPGDGICIYGAGLSYNSSTDVITRYLRVRAGIIAPSGTDAIGARSGKKMIFDHLSVSWGRDGTFDLNGNTIDSITLQNMIISHGLIPHSTGGLMNSYGNISVLRSLYINNWTRNPKVTCNNQYVNNVIYNWAASSYNFGGADYNTYSNVTNNYMISGQGGTREGIMGGDPYVNAYLKGNFWDSNRNGKLDGTEYTAYSDSIVRATTPYLFPPIKNEMTAVQSYYNVIADAGASLHRDQVDSLLMIDLKSLGTKGIFIRTEDTLETKGPGVIKGGITPKDTDQDGMPDTWEKQFGFNYLLPDNNGDADKDGYTNLEEYLNCLVGEGSCTAPSCYALIYESQNDTICEGNSKTLTANAGASYKWYKGTTQVGISASYNVTSSGVYKVEVTNANNCKATSPSVTITVVPLPVATITPQSSTTFCEGGTVVLSASTASTYKWYNGTNLVASSKTYTATTSGSYTVELENAGCKKTSLPTIVAVNALPVATVTMSGDLTLCAGETVTFTANGASSYKWLNGTTQVGTLQSLKTSDAGSYTVEVTNAAGCKKTSSAYVVKVNPLPVITQNVRVNNGSWKGIDSVSVCKGSTVEMGPFPNVATGWSWSGPNNYSSNLRNPILSNVSLSGAYYSTYTDANGCKATSPVKITVNALPIATITASGALTFCNGGSVNLTSSTGSSYVWRNGTTTVTTAASYTAKTSGNYSVIVTNASGCKDTSVATTVTVNALPTATITASGATTFCNGGSINLTSSTGSSYIWRNGTTTVATTASYSAKTAGSYSVILTNASGCKDTSAATTVTVNALPTASITASGALTFCNGGSVNLTSSTGSSYVWRNGTTSVATTASYSAKTAGSYTVIVTNASGCKDTSTATTLTVNTTATPSIITGDDIVCANATSRSYSITNIADATAYTWTVPTGASITSGANTNAIIVSFASASGNVSVSATNECGVGSVIKKAVSIVTNCITFDALSTKTSIDLTWDIAGINVKSIQIMRNTNSTTTGRIRLTTVGYSPQIYSDASALDNTDYWYWLKITDVNNVIYNSNSVQGKIAVVTGVNPVTTSETSVYPNPYEHDFQIKKQGAFHYSIEDLHGKTLVKGEANDEIFTGNSLPTGVYILKITANNNTEIVKVVKK